jgi:glycerol-3-phosphate dehydrogenase
VLVAARFEQARSVGDVLLRRTRLGILAAPQLRTAESVRPVAEVLGGELGWSTEEVASSADAWLAEAEAEGIDPAASVQGSIVKPHMESERLEDMG